jgi:MFS family permease
MSPQKTILSGESSPTVQEFRSGYQALIASFVGAGCGISSICFYTNSVFVAAIDQDMSWTRGEIQIGISIMILAAVFTAPLAGMMMDRFGARAVALTSIPLFSLSLVALSFTTDQIWTFYSGWVLMSVLAAGTLPITWTKVVNEWFDHARGLALGLTLAGTGIAAVIAPGYAAWLINEFGWRNAYALMGITIFLIAFGPIFFFFYEAGSNRTNQKRTAPSSNIKSPSSRFGPTLREAITGYRLWALCIALLCIAGGISGVITNLVPMLTDKGLSVSEAASYAGLVGLSVIAGRLLAGFLMDIMWAPIVAATFLGMPLFAALLLQLPVMSTEQIVIAALIIGLAAGAELDIMALLISRYFGLQHYGALYGFLYVFFSIGAGLAPMLFGWTYDISGNYELTLNLVAFLSVTGAVLILTLGRYPNVNSSI